APHAAAPQRLQELRRPDGTGHRAGADGRRGPERLRQVEPPRGAALGHGRDAAHPNARSGHGGRDLCRHHAARPPGPCGGGAAFRARGRGDGARAAHHARRGLGLPAGWARGEGARHPGDVRGRRLRGAVPGAGAAGADQRVDRTEAPGAAARHRGGGGDRGPSGAAVGGVAEADGGGSQPCPGGRGDGRPRRAAERAGAAGPECGPLPRGGGGDPGG
ncbi:MAG: Chromosome partition protein smc, partial [uncultured Rubellimicrobium sp.]